MNFYIKSYCLNGRLLYIKKNMHLNKIKRIRKKILDKKQLGG